MEKSSAASLRIGAWLVDPNSGEISRGGESARLEARALRLLLCLAERAGRVISIDELLSEVWSGVIVTPDSVYQAVTSLRRLLGDDPKRPTYIATVPRLGYRMVATVSPVGEGRPVDQDSPPESFAQISPSVALNPPSVETAVPTANRKRGAALVAMALILVLIGAYLTYGRLSSAQFADTNASALKPVRSVAVLPFLDLTTQEMNEEYFADGMTEEFIDELSKIPGFRVPGPTSSFYFKDKSLPLADIAQKLGVVYVVDGSVRKSGTTFRVAARLIRADDGYVVWTQTYDRSLGDILTIQKEIAAEAVKSLRTSIDSAVESAPAVSTGAH